MVQCCTLSHWLPVLAELLGKKDRIVAKAHGYDTAAWYIRSIFGIFPPRKVNEGRTENSAVQAEVCFVGDMGFHS